MGKQKKLIDESVENEETDNSRKYIKLYESDDDENIVSDNSFIFFTNIKIYSEEKNKLSKICCTKNCLFISTSSVFNQVHIFNFKNFSNLRKINEINGIIKAEEIEQKKEEGEEEKEKEKEKEKEEVENKEQREGAEYQDTYINLGDVYNKNQFFNEVNDKENMENNFLKINKKKNESSSCHNLNNKKTHFHFLGELHDENLFKEEYLYYDNFNGSQKKKNDKEIRINKDIKEEEKKKKEKEEEIKKKRIIEEENLRSEELLKNGYFLNNNNLEINIDIIKKKMNTISNSMEYIGSFHNISSPIILMKKNDSESILSLLTYNGAIYSYNITDNSLNELKEKRIRKLEIFSNIEYYLSQQEYYEKKEGKVSNDLLDEDDGEEATLPPLSIYNSYFNSLIKSFDFMPDGRTLICVGFNKDYFISFINCYNGKHIIYNKKIKVKKHNNFNVNFSLIYDFNYIQVEREKKTFNGEIGNFVYIGSSCGYLVFIFISENFLNFINNMLNNDEVRSGSLFFYDNNCSNDVSKCIIGNVDDIYKINKNELYSLLDDNKNSSLFYNCKENIFKCVEQNFFSYAFFISKNIKITSIVSLNTNKNHHIHLLLGLNDGRFITFYFHISEFFSNNNYSISTENYNEKNAIDSKRNTPSKEENLQKTINQNEVRGSEENGNNVNENAQKGKDTQKDSMHTESAPFLLERSKKLIRNLNDTNNYPINNFIKNSEKLIYDFTGLHKSTTITKVNFYKNKLENYFILINSNIKKIGQMSDKNFFTTYIIDLSNKKINILYQHFSHILDSCISSFFYFCLDDNNTITVFSLSKDV